MRKPVIDYSKVRISNIFTPQYSHILWLFSWVGYMTFFFLTENLIPAENCYPVHSFLDDLIPFCEFFIIPYVLWYLAIAFTYIYFGLYDISLYKGYSKFIIVTQVIALLIFTFFPTRQDLRPDEFTRQNIFTEVIAYLYTIDTNTGVCPSLHVAYSLGIMSTWIKARDVRPIWKVLMSAFCISVCLSTVFIKQHSVLDFFAALPLCLLAEIVGFWGYYKNKFKKARI